MTKTTKDGEYKHWGLSRVYGDLPAKKAIAQTHRQLVSQVLATPIKSLLDDIDTSSALAGIAASELCRKTAAFRS